MKFYSEVTKKLYDNQEELEKAELEIVDKTNARKKDAELVDKAFAAVKEAQDNYYKVLSEFCKKYGAYHKTIKDDDLKDFSLNDWKTLIDWIF